MKEFIQYWKQTDAPNELKDLLQSGEFISYIPRDYLKDMKLEMKENIKILIKEDLKKYNGIIIVSKIEPKFKLYNVNFKEINKIGD
jgi:hypothetical protein